MWLCASQSDIAESDYACRLSIYYGDAQLAIDWFHKLGYTVPYLNIASCKECHLMHTLEH